MSVLGDTTVRHDNHEGTDSVAKLVRDRIPDLIRASGRMPVIRTLCDGEYWAALDVKGL